MLSDKSKRAARRKQQTAEVEASHADLRANIAEAKRLTNESEKMLRRHQEERDGDEDGGK